MNDQDKTKQQLVAENEELRRRVAEFEKAATEGARKEEEFRRSEAKWRSVVENAPLFVAVIGRSGEIQFLNRFQPGFDLESVLGKPFDDFIEPEYHTIARKCLEQVFKSGERASYECRAAGPEGSVSDYVTDLGPVTVDGNIVAATLIARDVTDRKRAEEALKKAHEELELEVKERTADLAIFRRFAEASGQGFGMADMDGRITYMNPALCRLAGIENPEDAVGKHLTTFYPKDYQYKRDTEIVPALLQKGHWEGELIGSPSGKTTCVLQNSFLMRDEEGTPTHLASVITDITERKRADEALRTSEERFRSYFEQGLIGMAVSTPERQWREVNDRLCDILGYSRAELVGMKWTEATHPDDVEPGLLQFNRTVAGEIDRYTTEKRFVRKDGGVVYANIFVQRFCRKDGTLDHFLALIEDITERKEAEEALRQSHDELNAIYDGMVDGILVTEIETLRFLRTNASICRMLGYSETELRSLSIRDIHPAGAVPHILENIRSIREVEQTPTVAIPFLRKDGSVFYAEAIGKSLTYKGRPCSMGIFRDITERKQAQEALEREQRTLLHMLRASDHERQTIAYDIHDGLAQQLAAATMHFQTYEHLMSIAPGKARAAYDAGVMMVHQAHFESRRLISGVRPPALDEAGVAVAISHLVHEQRGPKGPQVEYHDDVTFDRLPPILENAIYRIVQEALGNACEHSGSERVRVSLDQDGDLLRLEVQDWGAGFDPKTVDETRFGLAGIKERTRLLGGELSIDSEPGKGTCIRVSLPILEQE